MLFTYLLSGLVGKVVWWRESWSGQYGGEIIKAEFRVSKWLKLWNLLVGLELGMVKDKIWDVGGVSDTTLM